MYLVELFQISILAYLCVCVCVCVWGRGGGGGWLCIVYHMHVGESVKYIVHLNYQLNNHLVYCTQKMVGVSLTVLAKILSLYLCIFEVV